jgi:hypothetical protein
MKHPVYDGDGLRPSGDPFGPECKGHWVFTASNAEQPEVVDKNRDPILRQSEVYSGIYANVFVNFYPYAASGNRGIACGLGPIMKVSDGEPLTATTPSAAKAFQEIDANEFG